MENRNKQSSGEKGTLQLKNTKEKVHDIVQKLDNLELLERVYRLAKYLYIHKT